MLGALHRRAKRALLAADPGLWHAGQALETLAAVLLALGALRPFGQPISLFGALAAGFDLQCIAGRTRRAELAGMAGVGLAFVVIAVLGGLLGHVPVVGIALPIGGAFVAFRMRSFVPVPAFTLFPFIFLAVAAALSAGAARVPAEALAVAAGVGCALFVHAIAPRPPASRAYRHVVRAFCGDLALLLRLLAAIARGADPTALRRRIERGLRAIERSAELGRSIAAAGAESAQPALDALVRDQHEAVHAIVALRRSVEALRAADGSAYVLAPLFDRLAAAFDAIAEECSARADAGDVNSAIGEVEAASIAAPCRPPAQLGALAVAARVARRLDGVRARFEER